MRLHRPLGVSPCATAPHRIRTWRARQVVVAAAVLAFVLGLVTDASAYAWMIKRGHATCNTCHADPSGGELLSPFGRAQAELTLTTTYRSASPSGEDGRPAETSPPNVDPLWGWVSPPDWFLFGGAYRHMNIFEPSGEDVFVTFPMQFDLFGQLRAGVFRAGASLGLSKVDAGSPHTRAAQVTHGQGDEMNLISRSHYVGMEWDSGKYFLRAGRLNLPFGVRLPEHVMWAREATRTDRESDQQHGLALAYSFGRLRGELMLVAGNYQIQPDRFRERGYAATIEGGVAANSAVGLSSQLLRSDANILTSEDETTFRQAHGVFTRSTLWDSLVVLGEFDILFASRRDTGYVGMLQFDYEAIQGLHFMLTGEVLDTGLEADLRRIDVQERKPGFGQPRWGSWVSLDWYFLPQLSTRIDLLTRQEDPLRVLAQLHVSL